jgi:Fe-S-cluster containining protein
MFVQDQVPSSWVRFRPSLCQGCSAGCCHLPVEVDAGDLLRMELITPDEAEGSLKKAARRLEREGIIESFRARTGLFTLRGGRNGRCPFLGGDDRCTIYDRRPAVCRDFPTRVGPRVGYCPARTR